MFLNKQKKIKTNSIYLLITLTILLLLLAVISIFVGETYLPFSLFANEIIEKNNSALNIIFWEIRLPRTLLGILSGFTLGLCGAAVQGLFKNPLAEPGIIGVSASAGLGSVVVLYFGLANIYSLALPFGGLVGALVAVTLIYFLAGNTASILTLILAGIAINAFAAALTSLVLNLAPSPYAALEIVFWLLGSLSDRSLQHLGLVSPIVFIGWAMFVRIGSGLDALSLGEDTARSLGINLNLLRARVIIGTGLSVGAVVSVTGGISFVGLIVPHLLRPLVRHEPGRLLLPSGVAGAILVLASDIATRVIPTNPDLQLGVVTAIIGAPFFLYLILSTGHTRP